MTPKPDFERAARRDEGSDFLLGETHIRIYRRLLTLYPKAFREAYGEQMLRHFSDLVRHRHPENTKQAWAVAFPDLVLSTLYERKESMMEKRNWLTVSLPLVVLGLGLSLVVAGSDLRAMATVFAIAMAGMAALAAGAFFLSRRVSRPAESVSASGGGFRRHWWTFSAAALAVFYLAVVGRQFAAAPSGGSLISLLVAAGFASLIVAGLLLRSRGKAPLGQWLAIFGSAPGLAFFWFAPALFLGCLAIVGALSEVITARTRSGLA